MPGLYVSPHGDDSSSGSLDHPFATLDRALRAAREIPGDVVVHLREGVHTLTAPLHLTGDDDRLTVQAHGYGGGAPERAVVSGGRAITGWRERDGVWLADVGDLDVRRLQVDGRPAVRAGIDLIPGEARRTDTGYVTDSEAPLAWRTPGVEFVYRGLYPWTEARVAVAAVAPGDGGTEITMVQPAFGWARDLYNSAWGGEVMAGPGLPTRVENDPSFLTEPGTFALDRSRPGHHVLHYRPRPGEDPARTRVVAPALEELVRLSGAREVVFRGLVFTGSTWSRPGSERGFLHYHGAGYYDGGPIEKVDVAEGAWVTVPARSETIPAAITVEDCSGVRFEGCRFTGLGATALAVSGGTAPVVRGCDFDELAASAVSVTGARDALIEDNLIRRTGLDHSGSPGISVQSTVDCVIAHNHVSDVPHCGIVAGPARGTRILRNLATGTMSVLADGGGIYLSGPQGDSPESGAVVAGNVITDTRTPYNFALYTDYGAAWVTVEGNVVSRADNTAVLHVHPPLEHVVYRGNFWDADPVGGDAVPEGVTYESNRTIADEEALTAATAEIRARAGVLTPRHPA
ncbi:right-handed parallel beta-helix repeat-containing protein [Bailinhaonella thermotolerans]|uniref:Right-handed parallel beta-helix repeat-containing protein n=1 Tax=Bailinhaonella thermotolerans TaxID=1070861 RepID=A0A3A4ANH8_9ACTN|nr:right-handed parallel beta-helix repeat-containing protein [Bailinhaonella thermotolerans]RJL27170.1 right-handed parallel beta-helix repeat-containing protein [Bailinhaonella thermotolerans]